MTRSKKSVWLLAALLLVTFAVQEGMAAACTQQCVQVVGQPLFCRECRDVGTFTGVTCASAGPCHCYYVQNDCRAKAAAAKTPAPAQLKDAIFTPAAQVAAADSTSTLDFAAIARVR